MTIPLVALAFTLVLGMVQDVSQTPRGGTAAGDSMYPSAEATSEEVPSTYQGLPLRAPQPRTLHDYWPVFAGFTLAWIGIVGYMLTFGARMTRLADALGRVEGGGRRND